MCLDEAGWLDMDGRDCEHYRSEGWCSDEGYGPNWDHVAWGSFCNSFSMLEGSTMAASEACCGCGRGRLYGTSVDVLFREPRCFGTNISLSDRGIHSSFEGCRVQDGIAPPVCGSYYAYYYYYDYVIDLPGFLSSGGLDLQTPAPSANSTSGLGFLNWLEASGSSVVNLDVSDNHNALCGTVPNISFGCFSNLRSLNLSNCQLHGSFPAFLGSLPLEELDLSRNAFGLHEQDGVGSSLISGGSALPEAWTDLTSLRTLDLSANTPGICTGSECTNAQSMNILATFASLQVLRLSGFMGIEGWNSHEFHPAWQNLRQLNTLDLTSPGYYALPSPRSYASREVLEDYSILLPTWLEDMDQLVEIRLAGFILRNGIGRRLQGLAGRELTDDSLPLMPLCPTRANGYQNLRRLVLEAATCQQFVIDGILEQEVFRCLPTCFADLPLEELILNDFGFKDPTKHTLVSYALPEEYVKLTSLRRLELRGSDFAGGWPEWLGDLPHMEELDVSKTLDFPIGDDGRPNYADAVHRFRGELPENWQRMKNTLRTLRIDKNVVASTLPSWLQDFVHLTTLTAADCALWGELPPLPQSLEELDLSGNDLHASLRLLDYPKLRRLRLSKNVRLSVGSLPESIDILTNLEVLDLTGTQMSGTFPSTFFKLVHLTELRLRSCHVSGTLPGEVSNLRKLQILDLSGTALRGRVPLDMFESLTDLSTWLMSEASWLSGTIPASLGFKAKLLNLTITGSELEGSLPEAVVGMQSLTHLVLADNRNLRGSLPSELASMGSLIEIVLHDNAFAGTIPKDLGNLSNLEVLDVRGNSISDILTGDLLAPLPLFSSVGVPCRDFTEQGLTYGSRCYSIKKLLLSDNPQLGGSLSLSLFDHLVEIEAARCSFESVEGVGHQVVHLDFSYNFLQEIPTFQEEIWFGCDGQRCYQTYSYTETVLLRGNRIAKWPIKDTHPVGAFTGDEAPSSDILVDEGDTLPCFHSLKELDVSDNPLGVDVQSLIHSLAVLSRIRPSDAFDVCGQKLQRLVARNTSLHGTFFTLRRFNRNPDGSIDQMFTDLLHIDLSHNAISGVWVRPQYTDRLVSARFDFNNLTHLERQWFAEELDPATGLQISPVRSLNISHNAHLRFDVLPTVDSCGLVSVLGGRLAGNPLTYTSYTPGVRCTVPCAAFGSVLYADEVYPDVASLCQCEEGYGLAPGECFDSHWRDPNSSLSCQEIYDSQQCNEIPGADQCCSCGGGGAGANGVNCNTCTADTYSFEDPAYRYRLRTECRPCPVEASTGNATGVTSLCGCMCREGFFLSDGGQCAQGASPPHATGTCEPCPYLRTTAGRGALSEAECRCDTTIEGFIDDEGECGCDQNHFLNHVSEACQQCADEGEDCAWLPPLKNLTHSTLPPDLLPGYWAATGYLAGAADAAVVRSFAGHSIYKCFGSKTCVDHKGTCAEGREGVACSLCKPGYTGDAEGPCRKCEGSGAAAVVLMLAASPVAVLVAHALISGESSRREALAALRAFRVSARQLIKHLQVVGVVSGFTIQWPEDVKQVFERITIFTFDFIDAAGLGCLGHQQTATLDLGLRFLFPCIFVILGIFATPFLAVPVSMVLKLIPNERVQRIAAGLRMSFTASTRAVYWLVVLFFPTFLENGLRLFTCNVNPNEEVSVAAFPHLHCLGSKSGADDEWLQLLPAGIVYTSLCLGCCIGGYIWVYRATWRKMEESDFTSRGKYEFLFEDFRDSAVHWPVLLLCRDACVSAVGAFLNNYGASQLMIVAVGMLLLGYLCMKQSPYTDASNTVVELINVSFVFAICMFTAGMGFSEAPGLEDMATLAQNASNDRGEDVMTVRARLLLALQLASLIGPCIILGYQLVLLVPSLEQKLPARIRPLQEEDDEALRSYLREVLHITEGDRVNARNVDMMLTRFDAHELQQLVNVLIASPAASKGILREEGSSTSLHKLLKRASTSLQQIRENSNNSGTTLVRNSNQTVGEAEAATDTNDVEHGASTRGGTDQDELVQLLREENREQATRIQHQAEQLQQKAAEVQNLLQMLQRLSPRKVEVNAEGQLQALADREDGLHISI